MMGYSKAQFCEHLEGAIPPGYFIMHGALFLS
jgi:hypothetical protein